MNLIQIPLDFASHNILLNRRNINSKIQVKIVPLHPGWTRLKIIDVYTASVISDCNGFGFKSIESAKRFLYSKMNKDKYELTAVETFSHSLF